MAARDRALEQVLRAPDLGALVPQLAPELLLRVIRHRGIEDCGELLASTTPAQLHQLCDLDLWQARRPGGAEELDAGRFRAWMEALADLEPAVAARKMAEMDPDLVVAGVSAHVRVYDYAVVSDYISTDGELVAGAEPQANLTTHLGGFVVASRHGDGWEAVLSTLAALADHEPDTFAHVMGACRTLSNSAPEIDGCDDLPGSSAQVLFEAAAGRDRRREAQGYVSAEHGRAFLETARRAGRRRASRAGEKASSVPSQAPAVAAFDRAPRIEAAMDDLRQRDMTTYALRAGELAFVANALSSAGSLQGRGFTVEEARDAAVATCSLGLEVLDGPPSCLVSTTIIEAFEAGWTVLHDDVVMSAAVALADALTDLRVGDRETDDELAHLRAALVRHARTGAPWLARPRLEALTLVDLVAASAISGLLAECPVIPDALTAAGATDVRSVDPLAFVFISRLAQVDAVQRYLQSLPDRLSRG